MSWIEVINLHLSTPEDQQKLCDLFFAVKTNPTPPTSHQFKTSLYRNTKVGTNYAIHLSRESSDEKPLKSIAGRQIARKFRQFSKVQHTVWKKI